MSWIMDQLVGRASRSRWLFCHSVSRTQANAADVPAGLLAQQDYEAQRPGPSEHPAGGEQRYFVEGGPISGIVSRLFRLYIRKSDWSMVTTLWRGCSSLILIKHRSAKSGSRSAKRFARASSCAK
jgi:hypothetical protein